MTVDPTRFRDFCINEEARLRRFAQQVAEGGAVRASRDFHDVADQLKLLGEEGLRPK